MIFTGKQLCWSLFFEEHLRKAASLQYKIGSTPQKFRKMFTFVCFTQPQTATIKIAKWKIRPTFFTRYFVMPQNMLWMSYAFLLQKIFGKKKKRRKEKVRQLFETPMACISVVVKIGWNSFRCSYWMPLHKVSSPSFASNIKRIYAYNLKVQSCKLKKHS